MHKIRSWTISKYRVPSSRRYFGTSRFSLSQDSKNDSEGTKPLQLDIDKIFSNQKGGDVNFGSLFASSRGKQFTEQKADRSVIRDQSQLQLEPNSPSQHQAKLSAFASSVAQILKQQGQAKKTPEEKESTEQVEVEAPRKVKEQEQHETYEAVEDEQKFIEDTKRELQEILDNEELESYAAARESFRTSQAIGYEIVDNLTTDEPVMYTGDPDDGVPPEIREVLHKKAEISAAIKNISYKKFEKEVYEEMQKRKQLEIGLKQAEKIEEVLGKVINKRIPEAHPDSLTLEQKKSIIGEYLDMKPGEFENIPTTEIDKVFNQINRFQNSAYNTRMAAIQKVTAKIRKNIEKKLALYKFPVRVDPPAKSTNFYEDFLLKAQAEKVVNDQQWKLMNFRARKRAKQEEREEKKMTKIEIEEKYQNVLEQMEIVKSWISGMLEKGKSHDRDTQMIQRALDFKLQELVATAKRLQIKMGTVPDAEEEVITGRRDMVEDSLNLMKRPKIATDTDFEQRKNLSDLDENEGEDLFGVKEGESDISDDKFDEGPFSTEDPELLKEMSEFQFANLDQIGQRYAQSAKDFSEYKEIQAVLDQLTQKVNEKKKQREKRAEQWKRELLNEKSRARGDIPTESSTATETESGVGVEIGTGISDDGVGARVSTKTETGDEEEGGARKPEIENKEHLKGKTIPGMETPSQDTQSEEMDEAELEKVRQLKRDLKVMQLQFDILKFQKEKSDFEATLNRYSGYHIPTPGINDLKYWNLYPKQIKKWILFTKSEQGYFDEDGYWVYTKDESEDDEVIAQNTARVLKGERKMTPEEEEIVRRNFRQKLPEMFPSGEGSMDRFRLNRVPPEIQAAMLTKNLDWEARDSPQELLRLEKLFLEEQRQLAPDLQNHFRYGVTWSELKTFHPKIRRLFSFRNATSAEVLAYRKNRAIVKWRRHTADTASPAIQVDILTLRIRALNNQLRVHRQDKANMRVREILIKRRKGWMKQLKREDVHLYYAVLRDIRLRDIVDVYPFRTWKA